MRYNRNAPQLGDWVIGLDAFPVFSNFYLLTDALPLTPIGLNAAPGIFSAKVEIFRQTLSGGVLSCVWVDLLTFGLDTGDSDPKANTTMTLGTVAAVVAKKMEDALTQ